MIGGVGNTSSAFFMLTSLVLRAVLLFPVVSWFNRHYMKKIFLLFLPLSTIQAQAQTGSEIYLFSLKVKNNQPIVSAPVNITHHKGYDNQPFFHPKKSVIYFSSFNDSGRSDIKYYHIRKAKTTNLTFTNEREYSPTLTPEGKFVSCIIQRDDGSQDLGKYPLQGGKPRVLINTLKVGYHVWVDDHSLLLFVLGDSNRNTLHLYNLLTKEDNIIADNPGRSLHRIPGTNAISFVHKISKEEWLIKRYNRVTKEISTIAPTLPGREDIAWLTKEILMSSDGSRLFYFDNRTHNGWQLVPVENSNLPIKGISRLAVNTSNTKLAVVVSE